MVMRGKNRGYYGVVVASERGKRGVWEKGEEEVSREGKAGGVRGLLG